MKILITGATGLVGVHLVKLLRSEGHTINYLTTSKSKITNTAEYAGFYWDPENDVIDPEAFTGIQAIIHLAGASIAQRWTSSYQQKIIDSRVQAANLLLRSVKAQSVRIAHFITASGVGIYQDNEQAVSESSQLLSEDFPAQVVKEWERAADQFAGLGAKVSKLRTGIVLSARGGALEQMVAPVKLGVGSAIGTGKQHISWIHVEDLARVYAFVLSEQIEGVVNAVAPKATCNKDFMREAAKVLRKPFFMPAVPASILNLLLGKMHILLVKGQNVAPDKLLQNNFTYHFPDLNPALQNLLKK
jgi:uncharacterized protein